MIFTSIVQLTTPFYAMPWIVPPVSHGPILDNPHLPDFGHHAGVLTNPCGLHEHGEQMVIFRMDSKRLAK